MADRDERHLMRQRGAGARDVDEFSLSIGGLSPDRGETTDDASITGGPVRVPLASENAQRQQRFLQRQRGAGARDVDFSMNLGIPQASSPTGRISVAGSSVSATSQRQRESQNATPIAQPYLNREPPRSEITPVRVVRNSDILQRTRVAEDLQAEDTGVFLADDGDEDLEDVPEEEVEGEDESGSANVSVNGSIGSTSNAKKRRKKKSVLRKPKRRKTTSTSSVGTESVTGEEEVVNDQGEDTASGTDRSSRKALIDSIKTRAAVPPVTTGPSMAGPGAAPEQDSLLGIDTIPIPGEFSTSGAGLPSTERVSNRVSFAPVPAIPRIQREHGIRTQNNVSLEMASRPRVRGRPKTSTVTTSARGRGRRRGTDTQRVQTGRGTQQVNKTVTVTVRRLANLEHLNFIAIEEDDIAGEQLSKFRQKKSPNSLDILAQNCRESVKKSISALKNNEDTSRQGSSSSSSRTQAFKRDAIQAFGEELDSRLMTMTTALDHNIALTLNIRAATKQKSTYRETLLDLRKQREAVELQQDAIRAANEAANKASTERFELNTLLADIDLAVQRGREGESEGESEGEATDETAGKGNGKTLQSHDGQRHVRLGEETQNLAMRLQRVAEAASSADGRMGLLARIRGLNALLEGVLQQQRTAAAAGGGESGAAL